MSKKIIILGALSAMAEATALRYARQGAEFVLVARNGLRAEQLAQQLEAAGAVRCTTRVTDDACEQGADFSFGRMVADLGGHVDLVFVFYGFLSHQSNVKQRMAGPAIVRSNFSGAVQWCQAAAAQLEKQRSGVLVAVCSVVSDQVRHSNDAGEAAHTGLSRLIETLSQRLRPFGASAVVAKLDLLDGPVMSSHTDNYMLWATPARVAEQLVMIAQDPVEPIVYIPCLWRKVTAVVRDLPARILHKIRA
ncbi:SDR family NAD(P)-dependent oxidoreductase [Acetobacter thailandicus]|uniref:SDR family NAD(P)-dependent oxidoreductase n=1 Tax=Acetobacter thailandicus TaxID=1502842 RepID=UPI001BA58532|nr:SDR family NAD(P)-dependent oxidoreductase [Acetobacter thailandicus]MBS0986351.1 SDR family NAD(P)-dependent oxidoreductase [Acetobacter thailandicus]MBS1003942.1 SDR family NAD(P)-dependent oxidoreductase [Acetobacter thailandicus]